MGLPCASNVNKNELRWVLIQFFDDFSSNPRGSVNASLGRMITKRLIHKVLRMTGVEG
jgi:hypothetical protein